MMKECECCGDEFVPYMGRQRFCTRQCSDAWFAEERREAIARLRQERAAEPSTYHAHAQADADRPGGRWAMQSKADPSIEDAPSPIVAPEWSRAMSSLPDEPPLGLRVDDLPKEATT